MHNGFGKAGKVCLSFLRNFISMERGYEKQSSVCGRDSKLAPSESEFI